MLGTLPPEQEQLLKTYLFPIGQVKSDDRFRWRLIFLWTCIPWCTCSLIVILLSLQFRYVYPTVAMILALLVSCAGLIPPTLQLRQADTMQKRSWAFYGLFAVCVASLTSLYLGEYAFGVFSKHYHELTELKSYKAVDPAIAHGQQLYDAGRIKFQPYARLDRAHPGCFQTHTRFCVAPIVSRAEGSEVVPPTGSFDFFAVGKDCCNCAGGDFRCGDWDSVANPGGLRMLDTVDESYYQLAVDQWAATYRRQAVRPIFVHWTSQVDGNYHGLLEMSQAMVALTCALSLPLFFCSATLADCIIQRKRPLY